MVEKSSVPLAQGKGTGSLSLVSVAKSSATCVVQKGRNTIATTRDSHPGVKLNIF